MDPLLTSALISGGSNLLGGFTSALGAKNQMSQKSAMRMQQNINQEQMKFGLVEGPAWEMAGLKKAGINPLLRYGQSGTPTGVSAQGVSQGTPINELSALGESIGNIGTSAADMFSKIKQAEKIDADIVKIGEELTKIAAETDKISAEEQLTWTQREQVWVNNALTRAQTSEAKQRIRNLAAQLELTNMQTKTEAWNAALKEADAEFRRLELPKQENLARFYETAQGYYATKIQESGVSLNPFK